MTDFRPVEPPALDIDRTMKEKYGVDVGPNGRGERRVVANLLAHLEREGFRPWSVENDDRVLMDNAKAVMEEVFSLHECTVYFRHAGSPPVPGSSAVRLIRGNAPDQIVSDWSPARETSLFHRAMLAFDARRYA